MYATSSQIPDPHIPALTIRGTYGYTLRNGNININIGEIANQREQGNISGTLSIELWALKQAYDGGNFNGFPVAGTTIGEIYGQHYISPLNFDLAFQAPPPGTWYLTLMLREWNGVAYETRDFVNFAVPYTAETKPTIVRSATDNIINVSFTETKKVTLPEAEPGQQLVNECSISSQTSKPLASELALNGSCGYIRREDKITINIGEIANKRAVGDISGTLSVELWALKQAYRGGDFTGVAVAGTPIGELYGQHVINSANFDLVFQEPPAGTWYLTLMLREWNGLAYQTRDFINFAIPYTVEAKTKNVRKEPDNIINLRFSENQKATAETIATTTPKLSARKAIEEAPVAASMAKESKTAPVAVSKEKTIAVTPMAAAIHKAVEADIPETAAIRIAGEGNDETTTSINEVNLSCLTEVKGVSRKTAANIVDAQPFVSFDDLSKVKGVGPKILKKLRKLFTL